MSPAIPSLHLLTWLEGRLCVSALWYLTLPLSQNSQFVGGQEGVRKRTSPWALPMAVGTSRPSSKSDRFYLSSHLSAAALLSANTHTHKHTQAHTYTHTHIHTNTSPQAFTVTQRVANTGQFGPLLHQAV